MHPPPFASYIRFSARDAFGRSEGRSRLGACRPAATHYEHCSPLATSRRAPPPSPPAWSTCS
eukprot:4492856-Pyramimonas_sp.AAC.1